MTPLEPDSPVRLTYLPFIGSMPKEVLFEWLVRHRLFSWPEFLRFNNEAKQRRQLLTAVSLRLIDVFKRVVRDLGVEVMPIKGIFLWDNYYRDCWHMRASQDVDIMIRPGDLGRARANAEKAGYRVVQGGIPAPIGSHLKVFPPSGEKVDVHLRFAFSPNATMDRLAPMHGTCHGVACLLPDEDLHTDFLGWHLLKHVFEGSSVRLAWADEFFRLRERDDRPRAGGDRERMRSEDRITRLLELLFCPDRTRPRHADPVEHYFQKNFSYVDFLPERLRESMTGSKVRTVDPPRSLLMALFHQLFPERP